MPTENGSVRFDRMNRKQAVTTCYTLEDMRDSALREIGRQKAAHEAEREKTRNLMEELVKAKHIIARLVADRAKADAEAQP